MRPRRSNVSEQNDAIGEEIVLCTEAFRNRSASYPEALYGFLAAKGVDLSRSVLVSVSIAEQGTNPVCGLLLTQNERFIDFDIDFDTDGREVLDVHAWNDETDAQNLDAHNRGFGKGLGRIALEVLRRSRDAG